MAFNPTSFNSVFGTLTDSVKAELTEQYNAKRILGNEYATVYAQLMDRALQLAYGDQVEQQKIASMKKDDEVKSQQIASMIKDNEVKNQQITSMINDDTLKTAKNASDIAVNSKQIEGIQADISLKGIQGKEAELNGIADRSLKAAQEGIYFADIELKTTQKNEMLLSGVIDRDLKTAQKNELIAKKDELLLNGAKDRLFKDAQILKIQKESDFLEIQSSELLSNGEKDRLLKDTQILKIQEEKDLLKTQNSELLLNGVKDRALKESQKLLYDRQKKGFDDNVKQKLFDSQVNSWGLMFSSGMLEEKPDFITNNAVTALYNDIISGI